MSNTTRHVSQRQHMKEVVGQTTQNDKRIEDLISAVGSINAGLVRLDEANTEHQRTFDALAVESERTETELLDKIKEASNALAIVDIKIIDLTRDLYRLRKDYDETATRVMLLKWAFVFVLIAFAALWWAG